MIASKSEKRFMFVCRWGGIGLSMGVGCPYPAGRKTIVTRVPDLQMKQPFFASSFSVTHSIANLLFSLLAQSIMHIVIALYTDTHT